MIKHFKSAGGTKELANVTDATSLLAYSCVPVKRGQWWIPVAVLPAFCILPCIQQIRSCSHLMAYGDGHGQGQCEGGESSRTMQRLRELLPGSWESTLTVKWNLSNVNSAFWLTFWYNMYDGNQHFNFCNNCHNTKVLFRIFLLLSGVLVFMVPYTCAVWTSYSCCGNVSNEILEFSVLKNLKWVIKETCLHFISLVKGRKNNSHNTLWQNLPN